MREIKWYDCPVCGRKFNQYKFLVKDTEEGISEACIFKNNTYKEHKKILDRKLYNSIPLEKKEQMLNNFKIGMTLGESYQKAGLTQEEGFVVFDMNMGTSHFIHDKPVQLEEGQKNDK
jgi:hypothetical protein